MGQNITNALRVLNLTQCYIHTYTISGVVWALRQWTTCWRRWPPKTRARGWGSSTWGGTPSGSTWTWWWGPGDSWTFSRSILGVSVVCDHLLEERNPKDCCCVQSQMVITHGGGNCDIEHRFCISGDAWMNSENIFDQSLVCQSRRIWAQHTCCDCFCEIVIIWISQGCVLDAYCYCAAFICGLLYVLEGISKHISFSGITLC